VLRTALALCAVAGAATLGGCAAEGAQRASDSRPPASVVVQAQSLSSLSQSPLGVTIPSGLVVWDDFVKGRKGIHLRAAHTNGSDAARIYDSVNGFTLELSLDPGSRWVAFSPCCRDTLPRLVVASTDGGRTKEPLAHQRQFHSVGGIGWSPNGKQIAFEGYSGPEGQVKRAIYTIRPSGRGLRHVLDLPLTEDGPASNEALAWSRNGILYSDGQDLRIAQGGTSRLVLPRATSVRISGDGRRIVTVRPVQGERTLWVGRPDGSHQRQVATLTAPPSAPFYSSITPDHGGTHLLAFRLTNEPGDSGSVVIWTVGESPASAEVLSMHSVAAVTWN